MTKLINITTEFEGGQLTTIVYRGRPAWIAREVGVALGYADGGRRLTSKIRGDWSGEFIEGTDFTVLAGKELQHFKALVEVSTESVPSRAPHVMLLFESGLHICCVRTAKPIGVKLRRFLADQVLPQLVRDGRYLPEREAADIPPAIDDLKARKLAVAEAREARLEREMKRRALKQLTTAMRASGTYDSDVVMTYEICTAEAATGQLFPQLKPAMDPEWQSPTQIGQRLGVSAQRIGIAISALGLRGKQEGMCRAIVNKSRSTDRTVISFLYSPKAVEMIEAHMRKSTLAQ